MLGEKKLCISVVPVALLLGKIMCHFPNCSNLMNCGCKLGRIMSQTLYLQNCRSVKLQKCKKNLPSVNNPLLNAQLSILFFILLIAHSPIKAAVRFNKVLFKPVLCD